MGLGFTYTRAANIKNVKAVRIMRTMFFAGILMLAMPFYGNAQNAPTFDTVFFTRSVCENNGTIDISALLNAHDIDPGQNVSIFQSIPASIGTVNIPTGAETAPSGGAVTFSGITYTPNLDTSGNEHLQFTIEDDHGDGIGSFVDIYIIINGKPKPSFASTDLAVCTGTDSVFLAFTDSVKNTGPIPTTFLSRGVTGTFIVPEGVHSIKFDISGSVGGGDNVSGNSQPGKGGQVTGVMTVDPSDVLFINVGLRGVAPDPPSFPNPARGFGGGGGAFLSPSGGGGSGGGGTDIRVNFNTLAARRAVAGGGGGAGASVALAPMAGGDGGFPAGTASAVNGGGTSAAGGTQVGPGAGATYIGYTPAGSNGDLLGYQGGDGSTTGVSGGGGGGYYGGGGGLWTGGGGGSSWVDPLKTSSVVFSNGVQAGDGIAKIIYELPSTYTIDYDNVANDSGFVDVSATGPIPKTGIPLTVPADAPAHKYNATITFSNGVCSSGPIPFTVEIKQTPQVNVVNNQVVCSNIGSTINFTPLISSGSPTYEWTNDNTAIGAASSGTGDITFTAINTGTVPLVATFTVTPKENGCTGTPVSFTITSNPLPGLTLGTLPLEVCEGATSVPLPFSDLVNIGKFTNTYNYLSGNTLPQTFTVPSGVNTVEFTVVGAIGGSDDLSSSPNPGKGGKIKGLLNVTPGEILNIYVGGRGFNGSLYGAAGGYNGGADAYYYSGMGSGGAGGGASDIRRLGTALANRIIVAGGGGGSGYDNPLGYAGGNGGGLTGGSSAMNVNGSVAGGGTQSAGGAGATFLSFVPGSAGSLGMGGNGSLEGISGGGGGGYYGGGGGVWTGGGGGSSYTDPVSTTLVIDSAGVNIGDGYVVLEYQTVGKYSIVWGSSAISQGFQNVASTDIPSTSPFIIPVSDTADAGTYTGTLTIDNGLCPRDYPFSIIVHPKPDVTVTPLTQPAVCVGDTITTIAITGTLPSTKFYLTNDNPSIGALPAFDSADIYPAMVTTNSTAVTQVASVTITPVSLLGCVGTSASFTVTVNPAPKLSTPLTDAVCSNSFSTYVANSATPGTTYSWERLAISDISTPPSTGTTAAIGEALTNTSFVQVPVYYTYSLTANGCTASETVTVTVNPTPALSNFPLKDTICSGQDKHIVPVSFVNGATYTWAVNFTPGSSIPDSTSGADSVTLIFGNTRNDASINVRVDFEITANGCVYNQAFNRVIRPDAELISDHSRSVCSGAQFQYTPELSITDPAIVTSYIWNRISVAGITTPDVNLGNVDIDHALTNTTTQPITVPYEFQLSADGCPSPFDTVFVTVNPIPHLSSTKDTAVCSGSPFTYTPASATSAAPGTLTYGWIRLIPSGITATGAPFGSGNASAVYTNPGTTPQQVRLIYTLEYQGCVDETNLDTVLLAVNPTPKFTSSFDPIKWCDSLKLEIKPTSSTPGTTFTWSRPGPSVIPGIVNVAATGTGNSQEYLYNTTNTPVTTYYDFSISANGCPGETKRQYVTVQPDPNFASTLTPHYVCTNTPFHYEAQSYVAGASFDWTRDAVYGIYSNGGLASNFGTGNIDETLFDTVYLSKAVVYKYRVNANGCYSLRNYLVTLMVNPGPRLAGLTTDAPDAPCSNMLYQTFKVSAPPATGVRYDWYGSNAYIWSGTADHQSVYVNFNNPGPAYVRVRGTVIATGCQTGDSLFVNVTGGVADNPKLIYYQGQFICLQADMDTYQWGYDDVRTFVSTTIPGATLQNLYQPNADLSNRRYWVLTTHNGCTQKSYFNAPLGVNDLANVDVADIKVFPNPTQNNINVEINSSVDGDIQVDVLNLLGQKLSVAKAINRKATIDVSNLPAGCYLVDCYRDGVKIATSRFIKN